MESFVLFLCHSAFVYADCPIPCVGVGHLYLKHILYKMSAAIHAALVAEQHAIDSAKIQLLGTLYNISRCIHHLRTYSSLYTQSSSTLAAI